MPPPLTIVCFGEALWDILPGGIFPGGAPLNVAYHLARHHVRAMPVSAVGRDFLGDEIRRRIRHWGVEARYLARSRDFPTGTVRATLDRAGVATYRIARRVAWDHIPVPRRLRASPPLAAIVFGTLALRERPNRTTLARLTAAWPHALRVLDLNLRPPFDEHAVRAFALRQAQMVKLNHDELALVAAGPVRTPAMIERAARRFTRRFGHTRVCVTAGALGAGLLWDGHWFWTKARRVPVRDTVGAGDAFLGGLLAALLGSRAAPATALTRACRIAEFVAARDGATPPYRINSRGLPVDAAR